MNAVIYVKLSEMSSSKDVWGIGEWFADETGSLQLWQHWCKGIVTISVIGGTRQSYRLKMWYRNLLRLQKSRAWEISEAEKSYTEAHQKDFRDHRSATMEGQDLASTYVLCPCPRTGCPNFGMGQKGVMGWSVAEWGVTDWRAES